ncbi:sigma-70 family RNA polymerase sigma factor [Azospirillum halopraeferens]|uniref:sigma-70 family RNA polymerase sigma factor n=1 Tax=Azospirillum halopraeferens TaxID=34010 RepID=UPI0004288539|nr:sigma-70 family RNA polymerase sigma factor [Azospirillum halopraeferens]
MFNLRSDLSDQLRNLRRYALALVRNRDEAEDLVQETLMRAIAGAGGFRAGADLRRWLFGILHHVHASSARRYQVRARAAAMLEDYADEAVPAPQPDQIELQRTMEALYALPEEQRQALVLVALEGLTYQEAADMLHIPVGTLMSRLARGREALRTATGRSSGSPALRVVR